MRFLLWIAAIHAHGRDFTYDDIIHLYDRGKQKNDFFNGKFFNTKIFLTQFNIFLFAVFEKIVKLNYKTFW